eukprot:CAMPEP_0182890930 /NCGR_PEP_ID=MMETSP0034_2-20130328/22956_1 /TAXON_ID=156128 /ORGANISM="Nephroselmis pyriformis, Strain CCMP717" /LENGTH=58 /DNA_ID=CAMNT_0025024515 /DNA_START=15 /DNA_END=191 /DNA_ORIENTATION=+
MEEAALINAHAEVATQTQPLEEPRPQPKPEYKPKYCWLVLLILAAVIAYALYGRIGDA